MFKQLKKLLTPRAAAPDDELLVNAYCTLNTVPDPSFPHRLHARRDSTDPEMRSQLAGFLHYLQSLGGGQMNSTRYHVMRHVQRTRHQFSFGVAREDAGALADWALAANALLQLPDGQPRDPRLNVLVSTKDGGAEPDAVVPYPADAWRRKAATEARLAAAGLHPSKHLPPLAGEPELRLRSVAETGRRAVALLAVALRAESLASGNPLPAAELERKLPGLGQVLSPRETAFLAAGHPDAAGLAQFSWRYESLKTLEWALGLGELPWPDQPCDAALTARALLERLGDVAQDRLTLRPAPEILDALDLHYRLHWLVRQARKEGKPLPAGIDAGVVSERHHALNWLTCFEDAGWDDTDTPT
jgi:Domain of unknown function (DUF4272)